MSTLGIPMQFAYGVAAGGTPVGPCFRKTSSGWYFCCRLQYRHVYRDQSTASGSVEVKSSFEHDQLNPILYLHLADKNAQIHGSRVSIFIKWDMKTQRSTAVVSNSIMGFRTHLATQPISRIQEALKVDKTEPGISEKVGLQGPLYVLLIYVSMILVHWQEVLDCFQSQLLEHVSCLHFSLSLSILSLISWRLGANTYGGGGEGSFHLFRAKPPFTKGFKQYGSPFIPVSHRVEGPRVHP